MTIWEEIEHRYAVARDTSSDINEHLPTLRQYAEQCRHITEMGVRNVCSTWAFLVSRPEKLICYDVDRQPNVEILERLAGQVCNFKYVQSDVLQVEIEPTDLLFIDTKHTYAQLHAELELHASKARRYIIFHDTELFGLKGEDNGVGLLKAVNELVAKGQWRYERTYLFNNGLTVLRRSAERTV